MKDPTTSNYHAQRSQLKFPLQVQRLFCVVWPGWNAFFAETPIPTKFQGSPGYTKSLICCDGVSSCTLCVASSAVSYVTPKPSGGGVWVEAGATSRILSPKMQVLSFVPGMTRQAEAIWSSFSFGLFVAIFHF